MQAKGRSGCLVFKPGLGDILGDTIDQLLGEQGLKEGKGMGGGRSGLTNTGKNAGLYGQLPGGGQPRGSGDRHGGKRGGTGPGFDVGKEYTSTNPDGSPNDQKSTQASGAGAVPVPLRHRSRVAAYLERILENQTDETKEP